MSRKPGKTKPKHASRAKPSPKHAKAARPKSRATAAPTARTSAKPKPAPKPLKVVAALPPVKPRKPERPPAPIKPLHIAMPYRSAEHIKPSVIKVKTTGPGPSTYEVLIGSGLIDGAAEGIVRPEGRAIVVIDSKLGRGLIEPLIKRLDEHRVTWSVVVLNADEQDKSLSATGRILTEAGRLRLERSDPIIALGGGIVCDVTGFAASIYRRAVPVIQCPTTLLAMVDAAVGGKTGVNVDIPGEQGEKPRLVKNLVGTFHQPVRVICDVAALKSLPVRELRCGLAECLKHALLAPSQGDAKLRDWTQSNLDATLKLEAKSLIELVKRNVAIKARVVQADERETSTKPDGGRMMLNLGHTFAHAMETLPGLSWRNPDLSLQVGPLKHGEAVGLGLLAASRVSEKLKLVSAGFSEEVKASLEKIGLPTRITGLPATDSIIARMRDDKKVDAGRVRLILPTRTGACKVVSNVEPAIVAGAIDSLREPS
jgi:3-dehydroquinate synthetase